MGTDHLNKFLSASSARAKDLAAASNGEAQQLCTEAKTCSKGVQTYSQLCLCERVRLNSRTGILSTKLRQTSPRLAEFVDLNG